MSIVEEEISALKAAVGATTDAQLSDILGYSHGVITQWRRRGSVPDKARRRAEAFRKGGEIGLRIDGRRRELGHQVLYEGRCLAIFLAPSCDTTISRRFSHVEYVPTLREYASFFDEIVLACAEEIAARLATIEGNATDALESLTTDDPKALYQRVIKRAHQWRLGNIDLPQQDRGNGEQ